MNYNSEGGVLTLTIFKTFTYFDLNIFTPNYECIDFKLKKKSK